MITDTAQILRTLRYERDLGTDTQYRLVWSLLGSNADVEFQMEGCARKLLERIANGDITPEEIRSLCPVEDRK
jgi:hypothetical protein